MKLKLKKEWIGELLPEGIEIPSLTVINGPSMSGMPMVEYTFISAWLKQGGNVILIPIHHPSIELSKKILKESFNLDVEDYLNQIIYIQFEPKIDFLEDGNIVKANLLKPEIWDKVINYGNKIFDKSSIGTLVSAFGLGQLLFSPTYNNVITEKIKEIVKDESRTYLISPSSEKEKFKIFPEMADNLIITMLKNHKAYCKVERAKEVKFLDKEIPLPFSKEIVKEIAEVVAKRKMKLRPVLKRI